MCMRERLGGELLWMLNLVVIGVGGVLLIPLGRMGWGFGRILGGVGVYFVATPDLKLGDGSKIRFWDDVWCGELALKVAFPVLYGVACDKNACVAAHLDFSSGSLQWDVSFLRAAHDWEVDVLASFYTLLYSHRERREGVDKLWWVPSLKGKFDVRSFYRVLACKDDASFPRRVFGRLRFLLKWLSSLGRWL
jgi:hypothetical protein